MSDKQQIGLFKIAKEEVTELFLKRFGLEVNSLDDIIDQITSIPTGERKPLELDFKRSIKNKFSPLNIRGFYVSVPTEFNWADFFEPHLSENHEINNKLLNNRRTYHKSFFIFIYSQENLYCFSGGLGYHFIKDYIDDDFGISALQKLDLEEDLHLIMLRSRSIVGNIAVNQRVFRDIHRTIDENNLGKIYKEVAAKIPYSESLSNLKKIVFENKDKNSKNVSAGQSFKFSKSFSLSELREIIDFFEVNESNEQKFVLSSLKPIQKNKEYSKVLINKLNADLSIAIYDLIFKAFDSQLPSAPPFYEITNTKYLEFYECNNVILKRGRQEVGIFDSPYGINLSHIVSKIVENDIDFLNKTISEMNRLSNHISIENKKIEFVNKYKLKCVYQEDDVSKPRIDGLLVEFLTGELSYSERPYFYLDSKWYRSEDNFSGKLNKDFSKIYQSNNYQFDLAEWGARRPGLAKENENSYLQFLAEQQYENTLVFHRVTRSTNMELCDVLTWDEFNLNILHIKPSFDGDVRVLVHQISHSSRIIEEDINNGISGNSTLKKFYNEAKNYSGDSDYLNLLKNQFDDLSFKEFADLFKTRTINYVACIVDKSKRDLGNISQFQSNIAKMSLIEGYRAINSTTGPGNSFLISQIPIAE